MTPAALLLWSPPPPPPLHVFPVGGSLPRPLAGRRLEGKQTEKQNGEYRSAAVTPPTAGALITPDGEMSGGGDQGYFNSDPWSYTPRYAPRLLSGPAFWAATKKTQHKINQLRSCSCTTGDRGIFQDRRLIYHCEIIPSPWETPAEKGKKEKSEKEERKKKC